MATGSQGLLGRIQRANEQAAHRFGPHTAEVEAFILAAGQLTPWQWQRVLASRQLVGSVSKEGSAAGSARSIQAAIRSSSASISEPMARAGEVLFDTLAKKSDEKQVAAWQAMTALITRSHLPALKFAVYYAPFAALIPPSGSDVVDPRTRRFLSLLQELSREQLLELATRWRLEPGASRALLQAVANNKELRTEETVALAALSVVPHHLAGDEGWSAVRTVVHAGRVLGALSQLTAEEAVQLWSPIEPVIPLARLDEPETPVPAVDAVRHAVRSAIKSMTRPPRITPPPRTRVARTAPAKAPALYGPNHNEVAAFIRALAALSAIQWLRVLDRRRLVASVTREGAVEPAGVVRSILVGLDATRDLDTYTRCRAFAAVERAAYVVESHGGVDLEQVRVALAPFEPAISFEGLNAGALAHRLASLDKNDWERVAAAAPQASLESVAPLVNAGTALIDFFGGRSDDEAVATWHAVSALVHRQHLPPIKFAASYAPFASAIPVTNPRSLGAMVSRYVTAVGRLGSPQCALLAKSWQLSEELSSALSTAVADGSARPAEEAAALQAVVAVPMRLASSGAWSAVKTAAFGGRVIAVRTKLTPEQLEALWEPIQPAIPLASLSAPARVRR